MGGIPLAIAFAVPLLAMGVLIAIVVYGMRANRKTISVLRKVATELELTDVQLIPDMQSALVGRIEQFRVTITESVIHIEEQIQGQHANEIMIEGGIARGIELIPEPRGLSRMLVRLPSDVLTGDEAFDEAVRVTGPPDLVLALFDYETRDEVTKALKEGVRLRERQLYHVEPGRLGTAEAVVDRVRLLLSLARRLVPPSDLVPTLAQTALRDPLGQVRKRVLVLLAESHSDRPETVAAFRRNLADGDPSVRLVAAAALGDEGRPVLLQLAEQTEISLEVAIRAAVALGASLPVEVAAALLDRALGMAKIEHAAILIRALGAAGDTKVGEILLTILDQPSVELWIAAAGALELVGTVAAVPALRAAADRPASNRHVRQAVATAVAAIQGRATGANPGQLSLSEGAAGDLSLADGASGDLSLADDSPEDPG